MDDKRLHHYTLAVMSFMAMASPGLAGPPAQTGAGAVALDRPQYTLGQVISAQGNEALRQIRKEPVRLALPDLSKLAGAPAVSTGTRAAEVAITETEELGVVRARARIASVRRDIYRARLDNAAELRPAPKR